MNDDKLQALEADLHVLTRTAMSIATEYGSETLALIGDLSNVVSEVNACLRCALSVAAEGNGNADS